MALDHAFYKALRASIEQAFDAIATIHKLKSLELGRIAVDPMGGFRATVTGLQHGALSPEEQYYNTTRRYSDKALPELGEIVTIRGQQWCITGQKTRGGRRIMARKVPQGGDYLLPLESFAQHFDNKGD